MITLHHLDQSRSFRILWLLEEIKQPYELKKYYRDPTTHLAPEALKTIHPLGKSPVIEWNGKVIIESGENLLNDITAEVVDGELILKNYNSCNFVRKYDLTKVYVTSPNLNTIRNASELNVYSVGTLTYLLLGTVAALFFIILFNIGLGLLLGSWLGIYGYGILMMAGFYLLILLLIFALRNSIKYKIADTIIKFINS